MRNLAPLSEGVPYVDAWRFVAAAAPALVQDLEQARAAFAEEEGAWQERTADYQRTRGIPRKRLESPYSEVLREAEAAVAAGAAPTNGSFLDLKRNKGSLRVFNRQPLARI